MSFIEQCDSLGRNRLGVLVGNPAGSVCELVLKQGDFYNFRGSRSLCMITCQSGSVWITQEHDHQDYVLVKGEIFIASKPGKVLVQALSAASVVINKCN